MKSEQMLSCQSLRLLLSNSNHCVFCHCRIAIDNHFWSHIKSTILDFRFYLFYENNLT